MEIQEQIPYLIRFLKENNAYYKVIKKLQLLYKTDLLKIYIIEGYKKKYDYNISSFFNYHWTFGDWDDDHEFWCDIHKKWMKYCSLHNIVDENDIDD